MNFSMHTNGKLLLTGEYFVTDGAVALALPTKLGQKLEVSECSADGLHWQSLNADGECWFEAKYSLPKLEIQHCEGGDNKEEVAEQLQKILQQAKMQNPQFLKGAKALQATTTLEFDKDWGLGTSSTLVTMIAEWAKIDPFELLDSTFGGSGYDIVAATAEGPMLFQKFNGKNRWDKSLFNPAFKKNLYFIYLGKKQSSREAMVYYSVTPKDQRCVPLPRITQITHDIAQYTDELEDFDALIEEHETIVQEIIQQPRAKEEHFEDFWGQIKSLGGWGGDFVLATSNKGDEETKEYFQKKGYDTVFTYEELIKEY
jgi:mevalonate kinase